MSTGYETIRTAYQTDEEFLETNKEMDDVYFKSGLDIFLDHKGFRKGEVHTFVGTKGAGKSTWSKTILAEMAWQEKKGLLYISEENTSKYVNSINRTFRLNTKTAVEVKRYLDNIAVLSEMDADIMDDEKFFKMVRHMIETLGLEYFLLDNFTTAFLSELPIAQQSKILRQFKSIANEFNIPVIIFFHTAKNIDPKNLDGDGVRGSATAINIGSYNYVIYQHKGDHKIRNFVHTEKARYHNRANKKIYEVMYNYDAGIFTKCESITRSEYLTIVDAKAGYYAK